MSPLAIRKKELKNNWQNLIVLKPDMNYKQRIILYDEILTNEYCIEKGLLKQYKNY